MKKNWIYLFMLMAITVMPLTSCSNDDDELVIENGGEGLNPDDYRIKITGYDALEYLQENIAVVNEEGEVLRRIYGKPLDASQPTVISVPVTDFADAESTFLRWVAPTKETIKVDGGYDYNLTDREGNPQGAVSFYAVEDEPGVIARMDVAPGTDLKQISKVKFIDAELWPENDSYPKYIEDYTYEFETVCFDWHLNQSTGRYYLSTKKENKKYYCIQGNNYGDEAILIWLSPDYNIEHTNVYPIDYAQTKALQYLPSVTDAEKVLKVFNETNEKSWERMMVQMDKEGYQWSSLSLLDGHSTGNCEFMLNCVEDKGFWGEYIKYLDLDSQPGDISGWPTSINVWKFRHMRIIIVPPFKK